MPPSSYELSVDTIIAMSLDVLLPSSPLHSLSFSCVSPTCKHRRFPAKRLPCQFRLLTPCDSTSHEPLSRSKRLLQVHVPFRNHQLLCPNWFDGLFLDPFATRYVAIRNPAPSRGRGGKANLACAGITFTPSVLVRVYLCSLEYSDEPV